MKYREGKAAALVVIPALFLCFGLLFLRADPVPEGTLRFTMIDVGQGDGFLLETDRHAVLVDGGSSDREDVEETLVNTIRSFGIDRLDAVFLTHGDQDHVSGVLKILEKERVRIGTLYVPGGEGRSEEFAPVLAAAAGAGVRTVPLVKGDEILIGELRIRILHPEYRSEKTGNEGSLTFLAEYHGTRILMTGDLSSAEEDALDTGGKVTLLKTAHHGSRFSTSDAFLNRVRPEYAVISYGKNNLYGHPSPETTGRLQNAGVKMFLSGRDGAVSLLFSGGTVEARYAIGR